MLSCQVQLSSTNFLLRLEFQQYLSRYEQMQFEKKQTVQKESSLLVARLPEEVLFKIFSLLTSEENCKIRGVCFTFNHIISKKFFLTVENDCAILNSKMQTYSDLLTTNGMNYNMLVTADTSSINPQIEGWKEKVKAFKIYLGYLKQNVTISPDKLQEILKKEEKIQKCLLDLIKTSEDYVDFINRTQGFYQSPHAYFQNYSHLMSSNFQ